MQTAVYPPRSDSRRRPRQDHQHRRMTESDARVLRGAEILRKQLLKNGNPPRHEQQQQQKQQQRPQRDVPWKSRDTIQRETARIREDLLSSSPSPTRSDSPLRSHEHKTTKARNLNETLVTEDEDTSFEEIWDSPTRPIKLKQDRASRSNSPSVAEGSVGASSGTGTNSFSSRGDAGEWADRLLSTARPAENARKTDPPGIVRSRRGADACPAPLPPSRRDTATSEAGSSFTYMGRDRKLKTKSVTHLIEAVNYDDDSTYSFVENDYDDDDVDIALAAYKDNNLDNYLPPALTRAPTPASRLFQKSNRASDNEDENIPAKRPLHRRPKHLELPLLDKQQLDKQQNLSEKQQPKKLSSPTSVMTSMQPTLVSKKVIAHVEYSTLLKDPAYCHAQKAGFLWQSLVGQHVRFPRHWWNGARGPPMGQYEEPRRHPWQYVGRYPIKRHGILQRLVRDRASSGRLLLHMVVTDLMTCNAVQDICIGCFHPNARGIRTTDDADPLLNDTRDVWMAVRKRSEYSVLDWESCVGTSPLGQDQQITNANVRVVFGEKPPVETIFVRESELYERMTTSAANPAMLLLEEFVFS